ncbi:MAG: polyprenyl synthetase family protein [Mediterranea sp.]|jgi:geranylgeranyl diphosphate synthase type II|nr:polyprenyl synthetase family protein [Mediterranea sp.]
MYPASYLSDEINTYISGFSYASEFKGLYEPVKYALANGGKRIRPVLMLMAYNLYKKDIAKIYECAFAIEVYHNCTLLHDDLMDKADIRRGKKTVHKVWNDNTAVLSGDTMLILAYRSLTTGCLPEYLYEVLAVFNETALGICEGQQYDMDFEQRNDVTETEYIKMIRLKTAILLAATLKIGAILGGASREDADNLYQFGVRLGIAFQLKDDLLDVYGNPTVFGKNIGGDILRNKKTYLLIKALECANEFQTHELRKWLDVSQCEDSKGKIAGVTSIYNLLGIKEICESKIQNYYNQAAAALEAVSVNPTKKEELKNLTYWLMCREL